MELIHGFGGIPGAGSYRPVGDAAPAVPPTALAGESLATDRPDAMKNVLDRHVRAGDGVARTQTQIERAATQEKVSGYAKKFGMGLAAVVGAGLAIGLSPLIAIGVAAARYGRTANDTMKVREQAAEMHYLRADEHQTILEKLGNEGTATAFGGQREAVLAKVTTHGAGKGLSKLQVRQLVTMGENISRAVYDPQTPDAELTRMATPYAAKAVAWYMMAQAAHQQVKREQAIEEAPSLRPADFATERTSEQGGDQLKRTAAVERPKSTNDMVTKGAFIMKDPDNRMYRFLASVPTCAARASSHVGERTGHTAKHWFCGVIYSGLARQRGIEDFQSQFPGEGGTMLFDMLRNGKDGTGEMFVKFEDAGCPAYFLGRHQESRSDAVQRFFASFHRNITHVHNFDKTRDLKSAEGEGDVNRHEHVYKGELRETVAEPFNKLVGDAVNAGVLHPSAKALVKDMKKYGLPFMIQALDRMATQARTLAASPPHSDTAPHTSAQLIKSRCAELLGIIDSESKRLGEFSKHGIERRGAEVHIKLRPDPDPAALIGT